MGPNILECLSTYMPVVSQDSSLLSSVLNTFLYDPLVEWAKEKRKQFTDTGEVTNEKVNSYRNAQIFICEG